MSSANRRWTVTVCPFTPIRFFHFLFFHCVKQRRPEIYIRSHVLLVHFLISVSSFFQSVWIETVPFALVLQTINATLVVFDHLVETQNIFRTRYTIGVAESLFFEKGVTRTTIGYGLLRYRWHLHVERLPFSPVRSARIQLLRR